MNPETIFDLLKYELTIHPKSQLIDLLKLTFQIYEGPGHLISNKDKAYNWLKNELQSHQKYILEFPIDYHQNTDFYKSRFLFEKDLECRFIPCSQNNTLSRISLSVISDKIFTLDEFFEAFYLTAMNFDKQNFSHKDIITTVKGFCLNYNFKCKSDDERLINIIEKENRLFSHSEVYHKNYFPSYRLINIKYLENFKARILDFHKKRLQIKEP